MDMREAASRRPLMEVSLRLLAGGAKVARA